MRSGTRHSYGAVTIVVAAGDPGPPRLGIVAGKKVGTAVERNRARRRIKAAAERVPLRAGHDFVVLAGPDTVKAPFAALVSALTDANQVGP